MSTIRDRRDVPVLLSRVKVPAAPATEARSPVTPLLERDDTSAEGYLPMRAARARQDQYMPPQEQGHAPFLVWFHEAEARKAQEASAPHVRRMPVNPELLAREMQKKDRAG